jgi:hypothetical protein
MRGARTWTAARFVTTAASLASTTAVESGLDRHPLSKWTPPERRPCRAGIRRSPSRPGSRARARRVGLVHDGFGRRRDRDDHVAAGIAVPLSVVTRPVIVWTRPCAKGGRRQTSSRSDEETWWHRSLEVSSTDARHCDPERLWGLAVPTKPCCRQAPRFGTRFGRSGGPSRAARSSLLECRASKATPRRK